MRAIDFEYDNQYLSDYGFIICDFNFGSGANEVDAGSTITFNKISRHSGKKYSLSSTQYDECITMSFDICKNPDIYDPEDMEISNDEYREIMRWLNRREFLKFQVIDDGNDNFKRDTCYYNASFNIDKIKINEKLYGMRLKMETDKPFGYGQEQSISWTFSDSNVSKILSDISDEIGYIYPTVIITINKNGDLSLYNELENCTTVIKNCKVGEVITLDGDTHIITTTYTSHDVCNDFNYEFFRIGNTINNRNNRISVSLPCNIVIKYTPIIKDTP